MAKRNGAFAGRYCLHLRVVLLIVNPYSCELPCLSLMTALAGYPFFGNHCAGGTQVFGNHCAIEIRGIVNHRPREQPMHHSVLLEEGVVEPQGRSSSSRKAWVRKGRIAKRNLRPARAGRNGIRPTARTQLAPYWPNGTSASPGQTVTHSSFIHRLIASSCHRVNIFHTFAAVYFL